MKFRPTRIAAPAELPVTTQEAVQHGVLGDADDLHSLDSMIAAAVAHLDGLRGVLGRAMITQTWEIKQGTLDRAIMLPVPDVDAASVEVFYRDAADAVQQVPASSIEVHDVVEGTQVCLLDTFAVPTLSAATAAPVWVRFDCGFGGPEAVPKSLRVAILQMAARMYEDREGADAALETGAVRSLVNPYRWGSVI